MQIVTDSGADLYLPPAELDKFQIHRVPLTVTLEGKSYREGIDITTEEFYQLLSETEDLPKTSQPSSGEFAALYRQLAQNDPEILSIHISSGLSGTVNSARAGAAQVPEARVTIVDTRTLSAAAGWQVWAAARANAAGWAHERLLALLKQVGDAANSLYTLKELKYLIHGGRISHMKGLIASVLNIKPLIGVETVGGTYVQMGQARSFRNALRGLVDLIGRQHPPGTKLLTQVLHSFNLEGAEMLKELVSQRYDCTFLPPGSISLVLGAHTGPSMVGVAFAPASLLDSMP